MIQQQPFFCSWSGGKDSCLALYHALQEGHKPQYLLTMMAEDGAKSRAHWLPRALIEEQGRRLGVPLVFRSASWEQYETVFVTVMHEFRKDGLTAGVFGDIDLEPHREWVRRVCALADMAPLHPLWKMDRRKLLEEFITLGFRATIIALKEDKLDKGFLGKTLDMKTVAELEKAGVDASGELGEYHTVVTAGPLFSTPLALQTKGQSRHDGYLFLEVEIAP